MIRLLTALLCLTLAAPLALADCHRRKVVVAPVFVVPVVVVTPTYAASYIPAPEQPKPLEPSPASTALLVLHNRCVQCHSETAAEAKGGGQILLNADGSLATLSLAEKRRVRELVERGAMPPGRPVSEAEKQLVAKEFK